MKINRIKIKNYKTYRDLELDLSVTDGSSIVLVGGGNGQGKTTLFEAICGALYGVDALEGNNARSARAFEEELMSYACMTANPDGWRQEPIVLEIEFSGLLNGTERTYTLKRHYQMFDGKVSWNVSLEFDGNNYGFGTHTDPRERRENEQMVNKIIKANLPKALSGYFFFDAAKIGERVDGGQVNTVVKETLLSVMGFQKFRDLKTMAESLRDKDIADRQADETRRNEFNQLVAEADTLKSAIDQKQAEYDQALDYCNRNEREYENKRQGADADRRTQHEMEVLKAELDGMERDEKGYVARATEYAHVVECKAAMPRLAEMLRTEILTILNAKRRVAEENGGRLTREQIDAVAGMLAEVLADNYQPFFDNRPDAKVLADRIWQRQALTAEAADPYHYLDSEDIEALKRLVEGRYDNPFRQLDDDRKRLDEQVAASADKRARIEEYERVQHGDGAEFIAEYERNKAKINTLYREIEDLNAQLERNKREREGYDDGAAQDNMPYTEMLSNLPDFFDLVERTLMERRRNTFEEFVRERVNRLIYGGENVVGRVSLCMDRGEVSFQLFHVQGNVMNLTQLSTAQRQILMQVLLNAANNLGDYQAPIVIDTIMGHLDQQHRDTLMAQYPELAQQTILFSNDREITSTEGLDRLGKAVSKVYTLHRMHDQQYTNVEANYFGRKLNNQQP